MLHTGSRVPWDFQLNLKLPLLKLQGEPAICFDYISTPTVSNPSHWATEFNPKAVVPYEISRDWQPSIQYHKPQLNQPGQDVSQVYIYA